MNDIKAVKQVIVVRKDLNMRKGKVASQASHASMGAIIQDVDIRYNASLQKKFLISYDIDEAMQSWLEGSFTKICLYVNSEEELLSLEQQCKDAGLRHCLIEDNGTTEFGGVKTKTCIAIGPDYIEKIDPITKDLRLL